LANVALMDVAAGPAPTEAARSMWVASAKGRSLFAAVTDLHRRLGEIAIERVHHEPWLLSQADYERALRQYHRRFAVALKRLDDGHG